MIVYFQYYLIWLFIKMIMLFCQMKVINTRVYYSIAMSDFEEALMVVSTAKCLLYTSCWNGGT